MGTFTLEKYQKYYNRDYDVALSKYGIEYKSVLIKYPTLNKRERQISTLRDSVLEKSMSLSNIDSIYGAGAAEFWLKYMLIELFQFLGAFDVVTIYQVKATAWRIRTKYYYLTLSELTYFFYCYSIGDYGKLYAGRTVNPQDILIGLDIFSKDVRSVRDEVNGIENAERISKEFHENKSKSISYQEWKMLKGNDTTNIDRFKEAFGV